MMRVLFLLALAGSLAVELTADDVAEEATALPAGAGKELMVKVCLNCHGTGHFRGQRLSQDDWSDKVYDMIDRGAKANDDEVTAVVAYLTKNFGKDSKVLVNTAPLVELKSVLGFTVAESEAVLAYRKDHPAFQEWRDLLKVPGIDPGKVEVKKDLLAF
jgi:competence ComEA-like helix-hairpin-helix protein